MGKIVHIPTKQQQDEPQVIQISKDGFTFNGVEFHTVELDEFMQSLDISPEAERRFFKGLLEIIWETAKEDLNIMRMIKDTFRFNKGAK